MIKNKTNFCNIPPSIQNKLNYKLHNQKDHPIEIIKNYIYKYFDTLENYKFDKFDNLSHFVSIEDNFDKLLIPKDHPARQKSDTFYLNEEIVLRTQTSAHQNELLTQGYTNFLVTGDVYRKDEIDKSHYPIFHQMEGVGKVPLNVDPIKELINILSGLVKYLFPNNEFRVNDDYFPFTSPSFEIEVKYNDNWLEVLGCGVMHNDIVKNNNLDGNYWAFGLGIDRLAMILFDINDIRYLWSQHPRFLDQFRKNSDSNNNKIIKFKPFSKLPSQSKDISFWIPNDKIKINDGIKSQWLDENDFFGLIREQCGEWIESVTLMDEFYHPKHNKYSRMYRIIYSPLDPNLKDPKDFTELSNRLQNNLRTSISKEIDVEVR